jgi:hypothetical protein
MEFAPNGRKSFFENFLRKARKRTRNGKTQRQPVQLVSRSGVYRRVGCGMEEVAMKLIFSGVNSIMVYLHVMTTEPYDPLRHLGGSQQECKLTGGRA